MGLPVSYADVSPLRYPGSKAFLVDYLDDLLQENGLSGCTLCEPFAGSAIVSLELLKRETINHAVLVERDPLIYAFWKSVFSYTEALLERLERIPITLETWENLSTYRSTEIVDAADLSENLVVTLGLAGLFLNRTSFSGILNAGPLGGKKQESRYTIGCRFNKERISAKIRSLADMSSRVTVHFGDALVCLGELTKSHNDNLFIYADPPYYCKGKNLYRYWYEYDDHRQLAEFMLSLEADWLVSYDDHEHIRELYRGAPGRWRVYIDYTAATLSRHRGSELLISNLPIPPESHRLLLDEIC